MDYVQLRAGLVGQFGCRSAGQVGLLGTVCGQEDLGREDAHINLYLLTRCAFPTKRLRG
jgi:hypothetical protein